VIKPGNAVYYLVPILFSFRLVQNKKLCKKIKGNFSISFDNVVTPQIVLTLQSNSPAIQCNVIGPMARMCPNCIAYFTSS